MANRDSILTKLRSTSVKEVAHPGAFQDGVVYSDLELQFKMSLKQVAGELVGCLDRSDCQQKIEAHYLYKDAKTLCCLVSSLPLNAGDGQTHMDAQEIDDPHLFESVDLCIIEGSAGVAENAAIWIDHHAVVHQSVLFLTQHLMIILSKKRILSNMHEAYSQLELDPIRYGCWISGPSKTADIEQSLVIGAHGPRSLTVYLIES